MRLIIRLVRRANQPLTTRCGEGCEKVTTGVAQKVTRAIASRRSQQKAGLLWRQWLEVQPHGHGAIQKGVVVREIEIERLVAEEAAASEANPDALIPAASTLSRPNRARSTVYSIRLNPEQVAEVQALADAEGLPA